MNLRIVSIFLLFLFSIVIAFPGYGSSARAPQKASTVCATPVHTGLSALKALLKKCLSKGINMIEEERLTEEEDSADSAVVFDYFSLEWLSRAATTKAIFNAYQHSYYQPATISVFTPPDCYFS